MKGRSYMQSVKIDPRSTSRLSSALFILSLFYLRTLKFTCINLRSQKRVSGKQPVHEASRKNKRGAAIVLILQIRAPI